MYDVLLHVYGYNNWVLMASQVDNPAAIWPRITIHSAHMLKLSLNHGNECLWKDSVMRCVLENVIL